MVTSSRERTIRISIRIYICNDERVRQEGDRIGDLCVYVQVMIVNVHVYVSSFFCFEDGKAVVVVELFVHVLELFHRHMLELAGPVFQDAYFELHLAQLLLVLVLLLLLVLLLQHLQLVLLLLQPLLDDLSPRYHPLLQLTHHVGLDVQGHLVGVYWFGGRQSSLFEEGLEVVVGVVLFLLLLDLVPVFLELLAGLVVEGLFDGEDARPHLLVLLGDDALLVPDHLVTLLLLRKQVLVLLLHQRVVLLLACLDLPVPQDLVPRVLPL